jgi:hypothetical protein
MDSNLYELPRRPPSTSCNARLARGSGYCENGAGSGTPHDGFGRCKLHGGLSPRDAGVDGPADLFTAIGLGAIIDLAETMTHDDQEYLMSVGTNALTVIRAKIIAKLNDSDRAAKEMNDLTMALARVEKVLADNPNEVKAADIEAIEDDKNELARVLNIEGRL